MKVPASVLQLCFAFVCLFWLGALAILADTHYVRSPDTCTNTDLQSPYTSWDTAATNIQWAVNAALGGETVWVSNGTYCLTNQIEIMNNITVKSTNGYSNTLVYAGWPTYTTRCFYVTRTGVVDGFTVSNGHYVSAGTNGGGGAYLSTGTIQNCYFVNNIVTSAYQYAGGAGIYIMTAGTVSNCIIASNNYEGFASTECGAGGIFTRGGVDGKVIQILNSIISNNTANSYGGAFYISSGGTPLISNCVVNFNYSTSDGSGIFTHAGTIVDCTFSRNVGTYATIWSDNGMFLNCSIINNSNANSTLLIRNNVLFSNCVISGNSRGGAAVVYRLPSSLIGPMFDRCIISNNLNSASSVNGGGIGNVLPAGGVLIRDGGYLRNCLINNNSNIYVGGVAGGVYAWTNAPDRTSYGIVNCTIVNNYTTNAGGGISLSGESNYVVNCVIANNTARSNSDVYCYTAGNTNDFYNCSVNTNLAPNQGNITNDPVFAGASAGNWRLANNSPCINTGTNMSWMTNLFDLDGRARIRYGTVDMGAYEKINEGTVYGFQ